MERLAARNLRTSRGAARPSTFGSLPRLAEKLAVDARQERRQPTLLEVQFVVGRAPGFGGGGGRAMVVQEIEARLEVLAGAVWYESAVGSACYCCAIEE